MPDHRYEFDPRNSREQLEPFDPERPRAPREAVRWILGWDAGFALLVVGGLWLWYLGNALVAFDEEQLRDTLERRAMFFWIATAGTVGVCLVTPVRVFSRLRLAARGEIIVGKVNSATHFPGIGLGGASGMTKIRYSYKVRGYFYRKETSGPFRHEQGDEVLLVVDPQRPKRCALYEVIYPPLVEDPAALDHASAAETRQATAIAQDAKEAVLEKYMPSKWWWCKLALGLGVILMGIGMMVDPVGWELGPSVSGRGRGRGGIFEILAELVGMRIMGGILLAIGLFLLWVGFDDLRRHSRRRGS